LVVFLVVFKRLVSMSRRGEGFTSENFRTVGVTLQAHDVAWFLDVTEGCLATLSAPFFVAEMSQEDQKRRGLG
jgi:hypothetical protein